MKTKILGIEIEYHKKGERPKWEKMDRIIEILEHIEVKVDDIMRR